MMTNVQSPVEKQKQPQQRPYQQVNLNKPTATTEKAIAKSIPPVETKPWLKKK
jgi:hypothetical protein